MAKKKKAQETPDGETLPGYLVPEKYLARPIVVVYDKKPVAIGAKVVRKAKPPRIDQLVPEATPEQYIEMAQKGLFGITLI